MKICILRNEKSVFCKMKICNLRNEKSGFFLNEPPAVQTWPINQEIITERKTRVTKSWYNWRFWLQENSHVSSVNKVWFVFFVVRLLLCLFWSNFSAFLDFPAPDINSKGQRSYYATRSYFLLAALLHVQKLRPAKRVIVAFKVPQINCSSFTKL